MIPEARRSGCGHHRCWVRWYCSLSCCTTEQLKWLQEQTKNKDECGLPHQVTDDKKIRGCYLKHLLEVIFFSFGSIALTNSSMKIYHDVGLGLHAGALEDELALELAAALVDVTFRTSGPGRRINTAMGVFLFCWTSPMYEL